MELSKDDHLTLKAAAEELGLLFFSSPFSVDAVDLLEEVDAPAYKIASGEVTNPPVVEAVAATGKPVLVSTGMSGLEDIDAVVGTLREAGSPFVILQCTSKPLSPEDVNLRAMEGLRNRFDSPVGLSDHTPDIYTSLGAIALGAVVIEKHFTLSRRLYGPDHHASLEPDDLRRLVERAPGRGGARDGRETARSRPRSRPSDLREERRRRRWRSGKGADRAVYADDEAPGQRHSRRASARARRPSHRARPGSQPSPRGS